MTPAAAAIKTPILRTAAGEPPLGIGALAFRDDQGEMLQNPDIRYRAHWARIGVLELEDGKWLSHPEGFRVAGEQFDSRDEALTYAVDEVVRRAREYMEATEGTQCSPEYGKAVIAWAQTLRPAENAREEINPPANPNSVLGTKTRLQEITDPVVLSLLEAHRARDVRGVYPAGHHISMTNPIVNGVMVTMATCSCGDSFSYPWGCYELIDAAVEAHRQKFDHLPEKVDSRGQPIGTGDGTAAPKKGSRRDPGRKRASPKKGEVVQPAETVPPEAAPCDAPRVEGAASPPSKPGEFEGWGAVDDLRAIARGQGDSVDREQVRHYVGIGYVHATTTRLVLTEEGEARLRDAPTRPDTKCAACCAGAPIGAGYPAPAPSEADRSDWEALWAVAKIKPLDEIVAADMIARGLIFAIDPADRSRGYCPTKAGVARVEALKPLFPSRVPDAAELRNMQALGML